MRPPYPDRERRKARPPLDQRKLEQLALRYVGRYATTRARLCAYLDRKVKERGWDGETAPSIGPLADRIVALGYVDDAAFAASRSAALQRRGYGARRIGQSLTHAGIAPDQRETALGQIASGALEAAHRLARRRKFGPYAFEKPDRDTLSRQFAAMVRAGHAMDIVRTVLNGPDDACDGEQF